MGKPNPEDNGETRLLFVKFGASGYVVKYRYTPIDASIYLLGVRNYRQAGFY